VGRFRLESGCLRDSLRIRISTRPPAAEPRRMYARYHLARAVGFAALAGQLVAIGIVVPDSPLRHLEEPTYQAACATVLVTLAIAFFDVRKNGRAIRAILALFLASMPLVYIATWATRPSDQTDLWIEIAGFLLFLGIAWAGYRTGSGPRPPGAGGLWVLAGGI